MSEPLTLIVARALAREPGVELVRLGIEHEDTVEFDVIVSGRAWELCALPAKMARVIEDHERLQAWIGGNLTPIGPIVHEHRSLVDRLTPRRMYADLALPVGNRVLCDELDHVVPAEIQGGHVYASGVVIDAQPDEGTVDVILLPRRP